MTISLSPELERLVEEKIKTGRYQSASEVVRAGLRLLDQRDQRHERRLHVVRQQIQVGLDQLDRGAAILGDNVLKCLKKKRAVAKPPSR